jgi:alkylhydroperoxidase family enzyme
MKVMGHCTSLAITEVPYTNSFIFDIDVFNNGRLFAGFMDRPMKELLISRTSLFNRCRYSVTHHSCIGYSLFKQLDREDEGFRKMLHLHKHESHSSIYTAREMACLNYAVKVALDPHEVTDDEFTSLKHVLRQHNSGRAAADDMTDFDRKFIAKWTDYTPPQHDALVDLQIVEITWLIGQFCLLNRWFTALQVPDERPLDEATFLAAYGAVSLAG